MTKEETLSDFKREFEQCNYTKSDLIIELDCAKEILNMLKEKDAEIEKKDKMIDLMARAIDNYDGQLVINTFKDKEHVKQYFEEKENENE